MDSAAFPIESEDDLQDPLDFMSPIHCSHYLLFQPHFCPPAHLAVLEPEAQNLACTIPLAGHLFLLLIGLTTHFLNLGLNIISERDLHWPLQFRVCFPFIYFLIPQLFLLKMKNLLTIIFA